MALPASDAFTGTNNTELSVYSANWQARAGRLIIYSNAAASDYTDESLYRWTADTFDNNQYAQGVIAAISSPYVGAAARVAAAANTGYCYSGSSGDRELYKMVAGSYTGLASTAAGFSASDTVRIEANGTTITPKRNGSTDSALGAQTDNSIASGYAGLCGFNQGTTSRIDDWEGGNLGGAGGLSIPVAMHHLRQQGIS